MRLTKFFQLDEQDQAAVISPLESVKSFADEDVRNEWGELIDLIETAHAKNLILDLGRLSFFGSTMLEWIVVLGKKVREQQGKMVICNCRPATLEVLHIAKFDTLWPIVETREDALAKLTEDE